MAREHDKNHCELSIQKTLAYRSVFRYPLSLYQLKTFLISDKPFRDKTISKSLEHLVNKGLVKEKSGKYFLPGTKIIDWENKRKYTEKLIIKNLKTFNLLFSVPWVKTIALTGSVSAYNSEDKSDLDLLIITAKGRLWITRFFVTLLLKLTNKFPNSDGESGKICTNLWMDDSQLKWPEEKQNIYIAHNIALVQPLKDRDNTYLKFLSANLWLNSYLACFPIIAPNGMKKTKKYKSAFINTLDFVLMKIQLWHMKNKRTTEVTTKHLIHFNKNDNSVSIMEAYHKALVNRKVG